MSYITPNAQDAYLQYIIDNAARIDLCLTEPTTYADAVGDHAGGGSNKSLAYKTGITFGSIGAGSPDGRQVDVQAISAGTVTDEDTPTYYALTDGASELIFVYPIGGSPPALATGVDWTSPAFAIRAPDL